MNSVPEGAQTETRGNNPAGSGGHRMRQDLEAHREMKANPWRCEQAGEDT
jgi:hypothetical protein